MLSSKLAQAFYKLNNYEKAALKHFVYSPYHNKREDVRALFDYLHEQTHSSEPKLQKERVWAAVYPSQPFNAAQFRYLMSFLLATLEDFLVVRAAYDDRFLYQHSLILAYNELHLDNHSEYSLQQAESQLEKQPLRDSLYLRRRYDIEHHKYEATQTFERGKERSLQPLSDSLEAYFVSEKLRLGCILRAHESVYKIKYQEGLLPAVLGYVESCPALLEHKSIFLYYHYYMSVSKQRPENNQHFKLFKAELLRSSSEFRAVELKNLYILAINYGIRQINHELSFLRETQELYIAGLEQGLLLDNNQISRFTFKNIVTLGLHLREFDWTRDFMRRYQSLLPAEYRETYTHYCLSKLFFVEKNYKQAMQRLLQVEYEDIFLNLDAKIMLIKIYYELSEYEVLESFLATFKTFLNRKRKILSYHHENYKNISRCVLNLLRINRFSKEAVKKLRDKVAAMKVLTEKSWILSQIELILG